MKKILVLTLTILSTYWLQAQEMQFTVTVNTPKLQTADPRVFENLETSLQEFLNNQKWTDDEFEQEERIECSVQLTIKEEEGSNTFLADLAIQSVRPVFGSDYNTPLLTHVDKDVRFQYEQFQPLQYTANNYNNNLVSIMSFYVYVILGLDYDSFSPLGGEPYFQTAKDILTAVPSTVTGANKGWVAADGNRNRYWIIDNLLTPRTKEFRQAMYDYHRMGLDFMHKNTDFARGKMMAALEECSNVNKSFPNMMIMQMFVNAKDSEIVEIFKLGTTNEKKRVRTIMSSLDAAGASKYTAIGR